MNNLLGIGSLVFSALSQANAINAIGQGYARGVLMSGAELSGIRQLYEDREEYRCRQQKKKNIP